MAVELLGRGQSSDVTWSVDYDDVSETIGMTANGTASTFFLILSITNGATYSLDATAYLNQGRTVLGGPGSVLGKNAPILPASVPPPPVKDQPSAYQFTAGTVGAGRLLAEHVEAEAQGNALSEVQHAVRQVSTAISDAPEAVKGILQQALGDLQCSVLALIFAG